MTTTTHEEQRERLLTARETLTRIMDLQEVIMREIDFFLDTDVARDNESAYSTIKQEWDKLTEHYRDSEEQIKLIETTLAMPPDDPKNTDQISDNRKKVNEGLERLTNGLAQSQSAIGTAMAALKP